MRLEAFQLDDRDILPALESGRVDLALGYIPALTGAQRQFLLSERYVVVMRAGHPLARRAPTRAALARAPLRAGALASGHRPRAARPRARDRVRLELPHFMVLPRILAETDLAVVMPSRLADAFQRAGRLRDLAAARRACRASTSAVHWFWRFENEPGNRWLRERIVALFGED